MDIEITEEFQAVIDLALEGKSLLITGGAGTGKTTLLRVLRQALEESGRSVVVAAPTGAAAIVAEGGTLHRTFGLSRTEHLTSMSYSPPPYARNVITELDTLIIDEFSMVSSMLLDQVANLLRRYNGLRAARSHDPEPFAKAFGYAQVILIGDPFQLPPVTTSHDRTVLADFNFASEWWLHAKSWCTQGLVHVALTKPFRQSNPTYLHALNAVRRVKATDDDLQLLNGRYQEADVDLDPNRFTYLVATNDQQEQINAAQLASLQAPLYTHRAHVEYLVAGGRIPDGRTIPEVLFIKVGARVVMTTNEYGDEGTVWINGSNGEILEIYEAHGEVTQVVVALDSGVVATVVPHEFKHYQPVSVDDTRGGVMRRRVKMVHVATTKQFPFVLGWAMTIHKSQGKTLGSVALDLTRRPFTSGHLYVGISRCRDLDDLILLGGVIEPDFLYPTHPAVAAYYDEHFTA